MIARKFWGWQAVWVRVFQRKRINRTYRICVHTHTHTHTQRKRIGSRYYGDWQVQNPQSGLGLAGWRPRRVDVPVWIWKLPAVAVGKPTFADEVLKQYCLLQNFLLLAGSLLIWLRPSINYRSPTHIVERDVLYSQYDDLNVKHIPKHTHTYTQNNIWPNMWAPHNPTKFTHGINCHTNLSGSLAVIARTVNQVISSPLWFYLTVRIDPINWVKYPIKLFLEVNASS